MLGVFLLLHNEPLPSFIDSLLPVFSPYFSPPPFFWFLFLMVFGSIPPLCWLPPHSPSPPSLLRHQTWALLRSVERALGSINRITGVARAGVYGVCLHRPGPGEGWVICTLGLPPSLSPLLPLFFSLPLLFPLPLSVPARLSWPLSFLQPRPAGLSLGPPPPSLHTHTIFDFLPPVWEEGLLTAHARVFVWMVFVRMYWWGFIAGCTVQ